MLASAAPAPVEERVAPAAVSSNPRASLAAPAVSATTEDAPPVAAPGHLRASLAASATAKDAPPVAAPDAVAGHLSALLAAPAAGATAEGPGTHAPPALQAAAVAAPDAVTGHSAYDSYVLVAASGEGRVQVRCPPGPRALNQR
jgi:hypothetical protein